jgi:hypothetical protein
LIEVGHSLCEVPTRLYLTNGASPNGRPRKTKTAPFARPSTTNGTNPTPIGVRSAVRRKEPDMRLSTNTIPVEGPTTPGGCRCQPQRNLVDHGVCFHCGLSRGGETVRRDNLKSAQPQMRAPARWPWRTSNGRQPVSVRQAA